MSFSAEMKDFLNAYKTGTDINATNLKSENTVATTDALKQKTERENDPETLATAAKQAQANLEGTRARTVASNASLPGLAARTAYTQAITKRLQENAQPATPGSGLLPPGMGVPQAGAVPAPPLQSTMQPDAYAEGGLVDDDEDDVGAAPEPALPIDQPSSDATDFSARSRTPQLPQDLHEVVKSGYKYGINAFGLPGTGAIHTPEQKAKVKQLAAGAGALTDEEMNAAKSAIDPHGKLTESQRNMAALGAVWQHWVNKGDPVKAEKVAFQMLQSYRLATQRYAAIAAHAAETGNVDLATKAALKAYANVPDGRDMQIVAKPDGRLEYVYTDENGKTLSKGIATPQQLASSAMGLVTGGFDKAIITAAGAREAESGGGGAVSARPAAGGKGPGALAEKEATNLDAALTKHQEKWQKANKDAPAADDTWNDIKNAATHLQQQNPTATGDEVVTAARSLMLPDKKEATAFKTIPGENGKNVIKFKNGVTMTLDDNQLDAIINKRTAAQQASDAADAAPPPPDRMAQFKEGAVKVGDAIASDASKFAGEVRGAIPDELAIRGKSALDTAGRMATDVAKKLLDPSINFGTLTTDYKRGVTEAAKAIGTALSNPESRDRVGAVPVDTEPAQ